MPLIKEDVKLASYIWEEIQLRTQIKNRDFVQDRTFLELSLKKYFEVSRFIELKRELKEKARDIDKFHLWISIEDLDKVFPDEVLKCR